MDMIVRRTLNGVTEYLKKEHVQVRFPLQDLKAEDVIVSVQWKGQGSSYNNEVWLDTPKTSYDTPDLITVERLIPLTDDEKELFMAGHSYATAQSR